MSDRIDQLSEELHVFRGEMKEFSNNTTMDIAHMSKLLNGHLDDHRSDLMAELKELKKIRRDWPTLMILGLPGILGFTMQLLKLFQK